MPAAGQPGLPGRRLDSAGLSVAKAPLRALATPCATHGGLLLPRAAALLMHMCGRWSTVASFTETAVMEGGRRCSTAADPPAARHRRDTRDHEGGNKPGRCGSAGRQGWLRQLPVNTVPLGGAQPARRPHSSTSAAAPLMISTRLVVMFAWRSRLYLSRRGQQRGSNKPSAQTQQSALQADRTDALPCATQRRERT